MKKYTIQFESRSFDCISSAKDRKNFSTSENLAPDDALSNASCLLAGVIDCIDSTLSKNNTNCIINHAVSSAKAIIDSLVIKEC